MNFTLYTHELKFNALKALPFSTHLEIGWRLLYILYMQQRLYNLALIANNQSVHRLTLRKPILTIYLHILQGDPYSLPDLFMYVLTADRASLHFLMNMVSLYVMFSMKPRLSISK